MSRPSGQHFATPEQSGSENRQHLRLRLRGRVQGVGMRPWVVRMARDLGIRGQVSNDNQGVLIDAYGDAKQLRQFERRLWRNPPPAARIDSIETEPNSGALVGGFDGFTISPSDSAGPMATAPAPDLALCPACRFELGEPGNRRYGYALIGCNDCGPRWSIMDAVPWDRERSSMAQFEPCADCWREYRDPQNRRYHNQAICCPACGPDLVLQTADGRALAHAAQAADQAAGALRGGAIVAVQGIGGFHLLVRARDPLAVGRLRARKQRPHKPLAIMCSDLSAAAEQVYVDAQAAALLSAASAPIVLLSKRPHQFDTHNLLAPDNPRLGVVLAYSPLHWLLLQALGEPVVVTSGNRSGEPICIDPAAAREALADVADLWLSHDRPIRHPVEDSVLLPTASGVLTLRLGRGLVPFELAHPAQPTHCRHNTPTPLLGVGGHQKCAPAVAVGERFWVGCPIDALGSRSAIERLDTTAADYRTLFGAPQVLVRDRHPGYASSQWCETQPNVPRVQVQHHHAHVAAVLVEHRLSGEVCGLAWDGSGYGEDATLWGGEALLCDLQRHQRTATLLPFALPGGNQAIREPRRSLVGVLAALGRLDAMPAQAGCTPDEATLLARMIERRVNSPKTTSIGRLFDAVAALTGLCTHADFEGQAALAVQHQAELGPRGTALPFGQWVEPGGTLRVDWRPAFEVLVEGVQEGAACPRLAADFHATLAAVAVAMARHVNRPRVVLGGGCFQNPLLLGLVTESLRAAGFHTYAPLQLPANDGALAVGQLGVARAQGY